MRFVLVIISAGLVAAMATDPQPAHTWPLSNTSLYNDTTGKSDVIHDPDKICFSFVPGPPDLGYSVLELSEENSRFEMILSGNAVLKDLSISMYIYPNAEETELSGTLLHYTYEDREIMRIRCLANTFLVSFRDEYGMSAGMMYLVNLLTPEQWNHVVVTRDYKTGTITVYLDGEEMYKEDDDFSDIISFPNGGKLRIGMSQDPDDVDSFDGNFACIEIFTSVIDGDDIDTVQDYCKTRDSDQKVYYEERDGKSCLTTPPPDLEVTVGDIVSITTLTNELYWEAFLEKFSLDDSGRTTERFKLQSRDKKSNSAAALIGQFNVTDIKVCTRLCMRVDNCQSFIIEPADSGANSRPCSLYEDTSLSQIDSVGARFYVIKDD